MSAASCIYEGTVRHRRHSLGREFTHRIALYYIDLDELPELLEGRLLRAWPGALRFRREDYHGDPRTPLVQAVRDTVQAQTGSRPEGPVRLLTQLRSFGHCFNPVSFYCCVNERTAGLEAIVAEVTSTPWRERHAYVLQGQDPDTRVLEASFPKALHVSPFMGMERTYRARASMPGETFAVHIESYDQNSCDEKTLEFDTTLSLVRRELSAAAVRRMTIRYPLATVRVLALIYAHALGLKLAGARVYPHPHRQRISASARTTGKRKSGTSINGRATGKRKTRGLDKRTSGNRVTDGNDTIPRVGSVVSVSIDRVSRAAVHLLLLSRIDSGSLWLSEDGVARRFGTGAPSATVEVSSPRCWPKLLRGSRGLAEAYEEGLWESPDLVALVRLAARNAGGFDRMRSRLACVLGPMRALGGVLRPRTRARRREDIAAHYDLGDELFALMLDPTLSYSCAIFERDGMTLEQAQRAKLERVCETLEIGGSDRVLEIGTGWGAFALYAAATRGCRVDTTTISPHQYEYARARVREAGLQELVTVRMQDYRDLRGRYDKLVSIEMIEAVGWRGCPKFLAKCSRLLESDGAMLLQAITIDDRIYEAEKAAKSFINTRIFPGGCLPSLAAIADALAHRTDMRAVDLHDITAHYVQTLRCWRTKFESNSAELGALGYDERFRRIWTLYLAYCEAGFAERRIGDVQLLLAKPLWRGAHGAPVLDARLTASHGAVRAASAAK
jgi:cyclopropane-fatty-acyl-phospholipid synthase